MGLQFFLLPQPRGSQFSNEAQTQMREFWDAYPAVYTRSDGVITICHDVAQRDWILRNGMQEEPNYDAEKVGIRPDYVELSVAWVDLLDAVISFITYCQSHWSCDLADDEMHTISLETFRITIYEANGMHP